MRSNLLNVSFAVMAVLFWFCFWLVVVLTRLMVARWRDAPNITISHLFNSLINTALLLHTYLLLISLAWTFQYVLPYLSGNSRESRPLTKVKVLEHGPYKFHKENHPFIPLSRTLNRQRIVSSTISCLWVMEKVAFCVPCPVVFSSNGLTRSCTVRKVGPGSGSL